MPSAETADDMRPEKVDDRSRRSPPHRDECPVARIERIVLRDRTDIDEVVFVGEWNRLEAPVLLEIERTSQYLKSFAARSRARIESPA
jgi:hypothetical protein